MSKKICLLTDSLTSGGAEKMVSNLSISLSKLDYDISIVSMNEDIITHIPASFLILEKLRKPIAN